MAILYGVFYVLVSLCIVLFFAYQIKSLVHWVKKQSEIQEQMLITLKQFLEVKESTPVVVEKETPETLVTENDDSVPVYYSVKNDEPLTPVSDNSVPMSDTINIMKVIRIEAQNQGRIYLHKENDCWCAYEKSAYQLLSIIPDCEMEDKLFSEYDLLLTRCKLPLNEKSWRARLSEKNAKCESYSDDIMMIIPASFSKKSDSLRKKKSQRTQE